MDMEIKKGDNTPPTKELVELIEAAGYKVLSIIVGYEEFGWGKIRCTGVIDLKIAPATFLPDNEGFPCFKKIPPCLPALVSKCRECVAQPPLQEKGSCQE
jgi:hypothetical protein